MTLRVCSVEGCDKPSRTRGWCDMHYLRWNRHGRLDRILPSHSKSNEPEHYIWCSLKQRCLNPRDDSFARYGGRGITVCQEWVDSFETFLQDVGPRPTKDHSIDRIDNNGPYSPENCRWATRTEQANNKRPPSGREYEHEGLSLTLKQWSLFVGVDSNTIRGRLRKGQTIESALSPVVYKTHCPQDHPYDEENTRWYQNHRFCRTCHREDERKRRAQRKMSE